MDYNKVFYSCVNLLKMWARDLHMTYKEINVWIFCIIEPIVFFLMLFIIDRQAYRIQSLKADMADRERSVRREQDTVK